MKMTEEEKKEQLIRDYKFTFGSPEGKRVLENLRKLANYDLSIVPTDNNGQVDIYQVMKNEGQRAVVIHILRKISTDLGEPKQTEAIKE